MSMSYLAYIYGVMGRKEEAVAMIHQIEAFQQLHPELLKNSDLCFAWWGIGNHDLAIEYMFKAIDKREEMMGYMVNSPLYVGLHDDPRFGEVKKRMNL